MADITLLGSLSESTYTKNAQDTRATGVTGNLEYVKMLNNDLLTARIVTPKRGIIKFALSGDFGFSLSNQWNSLASIKDIPLIGDMSQGIFSVLGAMSNATQASLESLWMTSASWAGYAMPVFSVSTKILNYSSQVNIFNQMLSLAEGMLPPELSYDVNNAGDLSDALNSLQNAAVDTAQGLAQKATEWEGTESTNQFTSWLKDHEILSKYSNALVKGAKQIGVAAPMNYGLQYDDRVNETAFTPKPGTTFALEIGNWFSANNLLMNVGNMNFSKEVTPTGAPVSLDITLTFRPYRNISFKEFCSFFLHQNIIYDRYNSFGKYGGSI